jgi:putative ABC transport system permease protein
MPNWGIWLRRRLRALFRAAAVDRELDDEIRLHIELETEELIRIEGLSPEEARRRAHVAFGGVERYRLAHREARGFAWVDTTGRDLRHAVRSLRRSPGFVLVSTLTLGLALGLGVTTYAMLDAVWHPYTPVRDADRVYSVRMWGDGLSGYVRSWDQYTRLRDQGRFYEAISFMTPAWLAPAVAGGSIEDARVNYAGPGLFQLLGIKPVRGRLFSPDPLVLEDDAAVLVSADFWRDRLHGRSLDGATVTVFDRTFRVVGVLPRGAWLMGDADMWLRLAPSAMEKAPRTPGLFPVVRLPGATTLEMAQRQADSIAADLAREFGTGSFEWAYRLVSMKPEPRAIGTLHKALAMAALLILLIGCGNLANLMLVRGTTRRRELALRTAIGASRGALVRLLLAEAVLVAVVGAVAGAAFAAWGSSLLRHQLPPDIRGIGVLIPYLSWRAFAFGVAATGVTVVLFGLLPALRASDVNVSEPLKDTAGTTTERQRHEFYPLATTETALALAVLMAGLLMTKAADRIGNYPFGYDIDNLWSALVRFEDSASVGSSSRLADELLARVESTDGVQSAALVWRRVRGVAFGDDASGRRLGGRVYHNTFPIVSPQFLRTLGIEVVTGRDFAEGDRYGTGAVIVDEAAADSLWPGDSALGRMIKVGSWRSEAPWRPVIGVARNARLGFEKDPDLQLEPGIYIVPSPGETEAGGMAQLVFRTRADSGATVLRVQQTIRSTLRRGALALPWTREFDDVVAGHWFVAAVFVAFSFFALGLAVVGLYGVLAYTANQRRREFGVRIALGARGRDLGQLVLHDVLIMVLAGTAAGAFLAMWGSRFLGTWLYDVPQTDAVALVTAEGVLFVTAMLAALGPVLGATRVSPMEILRAT